MKAVSLEGRHKLEIQEREVPKPDGNLAIVQLDKCGICGSETHFWYDMGDAMKGTVMGHEFVGTVIDPGSNADLKPGDRVVPISACGCGKCDLCRNGHSNVCESEPGYMGGFGEVTVVNAASLLKVPDHVSSVEACMTEPCATGLHAVNIGHVHIGDKIVVIGAGIIGLATACFARMAGATSIALVEINMERAKKALEWGDVDAIFNGRDEDLIQKLKEFNGGKGFDMVFECTGSAKGLANSIQLIRRAGTIVNVGSPSEDISITMIDAIFAESPILPVYAYTWDDFKRTLDAISDGRLNVKKYATKMITLDDLPQTFDDIVSGKVQDIKVVVDVAAEQSR